jgi:DNA-binding transcriptional regulator LsrR (DeoR family)
MLLDTLTRAKAAAILTCLGCSRDEIAEQLHVSLASVFRSLRLARELGMIGPPIPVLKLPVEEFDETCPYIVDPDASRALTKRLANLGVERVRVVPASPDPRINTRRVAKACSLLLRLAITRFAERRHAIGLTWGLMLREMIDSTHLPLTSMPALTLVPVTGELSFLPTDPRHERATWCSSNRLVRDLALRLGIPKNRMFLLQAPATITRAFESRPQALSNAWEMIERDATTNAILGRRHSRLPRKGTPMIEKIGTLFTGIGALEEHSTSTEFGMFSFRNGELEELRAAGIVGDLNGYLLGSTGLPGDLGSLAGRLNQLAVGASPTDLRRIAERRRRMPTYPGFGVILGAAGRQKARAVIAACSTRAINQIVVTSDAARAMLEMPLEKFGKLGESIEAA